MRAIDLGHKVAGRMAASAIVLEAIPTGSLAAAFGDEPRKQHVAG